MRASKAKVTPACIEHVTNMNNRFADDLIKKVEKFKEDADKEKRLEQNLCSYCYYMASDRIGGAAFTNRDCGICDKEMVFSSTCTDDLCGECASENDLCCRCGGEISMKVRRKAYPFESKGTE